MNRKIFKAAAFVAALILMISCGNDKDDVSLEVDYPAEDVSVYGGDVDVMIKCSADWAIVKQESDTWLTVKPLSGSGDGLVTVTVTENDSSIKRKATLTVKAGNTSKTVVITQATVELAILDVENTPGQFEADGGSSTFNIVSNTDWAITKDGTAKWVTLSEEEGNGNKEIEIAISPNDASRDRKAVLTVKAGTIIRKVEITQKQNEPVDFTIDDLVGTWSASGVMLTGDAGYLMGQKQQYEVVITKKDANTITISNFGDSDNGAGSGSAGTVKVDATVNPSSRSMTIPFQELTPAWGSGVKTYISAYSSIDEEETLGKDLPIEINATKAGFLIEIKSTNPNHPIEMSGFVLELVDTAFYSCFIS